MPTKRLNVRCCCQPTKILGTMEVPSSMTSPGTFRVLLRSSLGPLAEWKPQELSSEQPIKTEVLKTATIAGFRGEPELAVYGEERPMEFWRQIPTFREGDRV